MEGGKRLYTYRYTVTTRMTHALRRAAMRAIVIFHIIVREKFTRECRQTTTFEEKGEPKRIRTEAPPLTSFTARPNWLNYHNDDDELMLNVLRCHLTY